MLNEYSLTSNLEGFFSFDLSHQILMYCVYDSYQHTKCQFHIGV